MSSGHEHHEGFGLNSQALDRLLKNESVRAVLYRLRKIDRGHDVPYLAGYSDDGSTIYIDRHLPEILKIQLDGNKIEIRPVEFLYRHESLEKTLIDVLGYGYTQAHKAANAYERRGLIMQFGPGWWDPYQRTMEKYIKSDEHEKLEKVPKDLDTTPYVTPPVDHRLLSHLEKAMGVKKGTKEESNYNAEGGTPRRHCGPDEGWPHGFCKSFREENRCIKVTGFIDERAICDWYHPAKES